jgi:hypothetical protein
MHNHGRVYRAKIVKAQTDEPSTTSGSTPKKSDAMQGVTRAIGKRYYCEAKMVNCTQPGCDVDPTPRVITTL